MISRWGVAVVQMQRHRVAKESLTSAEIKYFAPVIEQTTVANGRHARKHYPLFGRYLLFMLTDAWRAIPSLRGIAGMLLTAENNPALVHQRVVDEIDAMCVNGVYSPRMIQSQRGFTYGQRVTPTEGPLMWHVGKFEGRVSRQQEAAIFKLFGCDRRIVFNSGDLIAA